VEIDLPDLPDTTNENLIIPKTEFVFPVAEAPFLDPSLLPSLEQVQSGLKGDQESSSEEETTSSTEEVTPITPQQVPNNLPKTTEILSTEEGVATFNIPFINYEFPVPSPEVIASSVIASSVSATAAVGGSLIMQSVIGQLKKVMTKIFKKVLKKEVANVKENMTQKKDKV
tara:strand:- start:105 stop:617 length:513 start_codon:yes stop_codon:yes gene_type:complete